MASKILSSQILKNHVNTQPFPTYNKSAADDFESINPLQHTTNLQKATLKSSRQKIGKSPNESIIIE